MSTTPHPTSERDVDLDTTDIRLPDGSRLTQSAADGIVARAQARRAGRPSLTGRQAHTPVMTVRVTSDMRAALEEIAAAQGRRLADVSRDALDSYIRRHAS